MAKDNLVEYQFGKLPADKQHEIQSKGGKASGEIRKEKATFKKAIKWLVESDIEINSGNIFDYFKKTGIDISSLKPTQLATLGLWIGAVQGNATNYKTLMEANEEIDGQPNETPTVNINIIDNSDLEKALYEED